VTTGTSDRRRQPALGSRPGDPVTLPDLTRGASRAEANAQACTTAHPREARRPRRRRPAALPRPGDPGYEPWPLLPPGARPWAEGICTAALIAAILFLIFWGAFS
jgi:hypothetical protein